MLPRPVTCDWSNRKSFKGRLEVEQFSKALRREIRGEGINAKNGKAGTTFNGIPEVDSAEMTAIGKAENTLVQFEREIDVDAIFANIRALKKLFGVGEPK